VTEEMVMPPVHPGEILLEEFLTPLGVSQYQLAKAVDVPARRINEIVHGQRRITADTALRLSRYFGTSERFWLNMQVRCDLEIEKDKLGAELGSIRPLSAASYPEPFTVRFYSTDGTESIWVPPNAEFTARKPSQEQDGVA
jgi:antitoxin HigA-1